MKRITKSLVALTNLSSTKPLNPIKLIRPLSSTHTNSTIKTGKIEPSSSPKSHRDSLILEKFRERQLKGFLKSSSKSKTKQQREDGVGFENEKNISGATKFVSSFQELGLKAEIIRALSEMGIWVPSEIQCAGIPALLDGKSVVLSSETGSGRTLAFLLPLIQLLRQDEALLSVKPKHPRAIVLCSSEELCDQSFQTARFISRYAKLNPASKRGYGKSRLSENLAHDSIGMLVATPSETSQYIEEGSVVLEDIKLLVLDEMDAMFDHGFGSEIHKILGQLKKCRSKSKDVGLQTVLVTSAITKMLGKELSLVMEHMEQNNAGKVAAMLLEMDQQEVYELTESLDALKIKIAETMNSCLSS
ncbi:Dead box ATP-dependent RNA helicase, putative isoform 3 [Hibiscus syriacus]|uniref:Dead box ATP-dependent RNA helicase, putative isoform 3 n=1 Tax=Hibiscus syriacus TaxID=106335 RepID=A0A6A3AEN2_HIBSY|nr:DEAD-box ATP-dependent RNA helicase 39-like [Hibiscus syriacus]KAE8701645.1 Dead box ATP-dependent RNA helicase, putative isoform 3 [Hibiscus syriacus]